MYAVVQSLVSTHTWPSLYPLFCPIYFEAFLLPVSFSVFFFRWIFKRTTKVFTKYYLAHHSIELKGRIYKNPSIYTSNKQPFFRISSSNAKFERFTAHFISLADTKYLQYTEQFTTLKYRKFVMLFPKLI